MALRWFIILAGATMLVACNNLGGKGSQTTKHAPEESGSKSTQTVAAPPLITRTVTATVPVGGSPRDVTVDPGLHTVYVTTSDDGTVSVIDGSTHRVTAALPVGHGPYGVAVDPGTHTVNVANSNDGTVSVIDGSTNTITTTVPVGKWPYEVAVDPGTHTVYVTNSGDGTVSVIESRSRFPRGLSALVALREPGRDDGFACRHAGGVNIRETPSAPDPCGGLS